jgi:hypothetical protein
MIRYLQVPHPVLTFGALLRFFGYGFIVELIVAMMRPRKQGPTESIEYLRLGQRFAGCRLGCSPKCVRVGAVEVGVGRWSDISCLPKVKSKCSVQWVIAGAPPTRFACGRDKQVSRLTKCPIKKMHALKLRIILTKKRILQLRI